MLIIHFILFVKFMYESMLNVLVKNAFIFLFLPNLSVYETYVVPLYVINMLKGNKNIKKNCPVLDVYTIIDLHRHKVANPQILCKSGTTILKA